MESVNDMRIGLWVSYEVRRRAGIGASAKPAAVLVLAVVIGACSSAPLPSPAPSSGAASRGPAEGATAAAPGESGAATLTPSIAPSGTAFETGGAGGFKVSEAPVSLPEGVSRSVAFVDGSGILLCGGLTATGTTADIMRIDPAGGIPTVSGRLRHAVHDAGGAALGDIRLVLGGGTTLQAAFVQQLVPGSTGIEVGTLPAARADLSAVTVGDQVVVAGGGASGQADPRVLVTSDGRLFTVVATLPHAVRYAGVVAIGGHVLVIGGEGPSGDVRWIQSVDVAAGTAEVVGRLPAPLSHATALVLGGKVLIAGGRDGGRAQKAVQAIDPATFAVSTVGQLPKALSDAAGVVVDGIGYLVGGEASAPLTLVIAIRPD
jgi:hypothetical protein